MKNSTIQLWALIGFMVLCLIISAIHPAEVLTYFLEAGPVMIGVGVLVTLRNRLRITPLLLILVGAHSAILCLGAHYTYAKVPLGFWLQEIFHFSRNHYDRIGHFAQGFIPAILAREILIRQRVVAGKVWLFVLAVSVALAFSAFYELIEGFVALVSGQGAESFLGTQGDVWDTQWDMFMALLGALFSCGVFARLHDRQLKSAKK